MSKIYQARNDSKGSMLYDMKLFSKGEIDAANERVKQLNKQGPKGWELIVMQKD